MINEESFYTPKLRVLVVSPNLLAGGAERWLSDLVGHAATVQYVRVIAVNKAKAEGPLLGVRCPVTLVDGDERAAEQAVRDVKEQYDVVMYWGLSGLDLRFTQRPVVHVIHFSAYEELYPNDQWMRMAQGQTNANYLACVSESGVEAFDKDRRAKTDVRVIHNGVDVERTRPIYGRKWQRKQWGLEDGETALLYLGRFSTEKGPERLIQALAELPESFKVIMYGWGVLADSLRKEARAFPGRVIFPQPRMASLGDVYEAADMVVLPSNSEAFPMVMIEAWQAGVPVVSAGFSTIHELERKYKRELVEKIPCPPNAGEVASGVGRVHSMEADALHERIAVCAQIALTDFTASAMVGRWELLFYDMHREWANASQYGVVEVIQ